MQCDADLSPQNSTLSLSLLELPIEILLHICSFLDAATLVHRLGLVCKDLNVLLNDDLLWKARINQLCPKTNFPVLPPGVALTAVPSHQQWSRKTTKGYTKHFFYFGMFAENDDLFWKLSCVAIEREYQIWGNDSEEKMERLSLANVHYGTIDSVLLMNKAKICVSGARDRSLVYWAFPSDENDGNLSKVTSDAHNGWIWDLTALHDTVYSCSWDRTVKAWKLMDSGLVHSTTYEMYMALWLIMIHILLWKRCLKFRRDVSGALLCVTSSQDLGLFAAGSFCKTVLIFDPRSERSLIDKFQPHQRAVVRISMNSNYILSASEDKTVSIWDQRARKTLKNVKVFKESFPMSISMQKGIVYVGDNGGRVHVLDPNKDFELVQSYVTGHKKAITGVRRAPGCLITSSLDKTVRISSPTHPPRLIRTLQSTYGEVASMDYSNEVLAISGTDGIEVWRPKNAA